VELCTQATEGGRKVSAGKSEHAKTGPPHVVLVLYSAYNGADPPDLFAY